MSVSHIRGFECHRYQTLTEGEQNGASFSSGNDHSREKKTCSFHSILKKEMKCQLEMFWACHV